MTHLFPTLQSNGPPLIKICGVKSAETALAAVACGARAIGVVLASGGPRSVTFTVAQEICACLPATVLCVAVVRNETEASSALLSAWKGAIQFHGDEAESVLVAAKRDKPQRLLIRAIPLSSAAFHMWNQCAAVDALLIDGNTPGSGERADWQALIQLRRLSLKPLMLAGGLTSGNVAGAIAAVAPDWVDVSSGVESLPGVKDTRLIEEFCLAVARG